MSEIKKNRNSSIEILRIISMIGVVVLHDGALKIVESGTINFYYLQFVESMFICAVNLFVMISAYFLSCTQQRRLIKIIELLIQVIIFNLVFYVQAIVRGTVDFSWTSLIGRFLPANYFVILYSALYLVSPYINILLQKLSRKDFKKLLIVLIVIFSVWNFLVDFGGSIHGAEIEGLSTVAKAGSQHGYSIVNFVLVYFVGAYIRMNDIKLSKKVSGLGIVICVLIIYLSSLAEHFLGLNNTTSWNYDNPAIIFLAAFILLFSTEIKISSKIVNELAKGAFTCFLLHSSFFGFIDLSKFVNGNVFVLFAVQFGQAIAIYLVSYVVYKVYYLCSHWFIKLVTPLFNKVDLSIDE